MGSGFTRILAVALGLTALGLTGGASTALAQALYLERLPSETLAVRSPADRVRGEPGDMQVLETGCQVMPMAGARQRIVDIALQEWAYFGFSVHDETVIREPSRSGNPFGRQRRSARDFSWLDLQESARLAQSIAGYWAITGDGSWIISRQNDIWNGRGVGARWRDPWSAAFISWVMCESGIGDNDQFDRAIAHHTYIDQAIRARDLGISGTAYVAYDVGEQSLEPGDLVCSARRPSYSSLAERRGQLGNGIRSHCDIVIKLEPDNERLLAIGGNVRGSVSLKLLPAEFTDGESGTAAEWVGRGGDRVFAHLKLRDGPVGADPFQISPVLRRLSEDPGLIDRVRAALEEAVGSLSESVLL